METAAARKFRDHGRKCLDLADSEPPGQMQETLQQMAHHWYALAHVLERSAANDPVRTV